MKLAARALMFVMVVVLSNTGSTTTSAKPATAVDSAVVVSMDRETGKVKWWNDDKGYGFITRDGGGDVFFPRSSIIGNVKKLAEGDRVEFEVVETNKGAVAKNVVKID